VRIGDSPWAPLFSTVAAPNNFTRSVEQARQTRPNLESFDAFLALATPDVCDASRDLVRRWEAEGHQIRLGPKHATRSSGASPSRVMASHRSKTSRPFDRWNRARTLVATSSASKHQFLAEVRVVGHFDDET
jgi:hypothetical protein